MIQLMTFSEFEQKFGADISEVTNAQLENAVKIYLSINKGKDPVNGKVLTRVLRNNEVKGELDQLSKDYEALGDHTIVYKKLTVKEVVGNIFWAYYKIALFNTLDAFKIKMLLKIDKLKVFS